MSLNRITDAAPLAQRNRAAYGSSSAGRPASPFSDRIGERTTPHAEDLSRALILFIRGAVNLAEPYLPGTRANFEAHLAARTPTSYLAGEVRRTRSTVVDALASRDQADTGLVIGNLLDFVGEVEDFHAACVLPDTPGIAELLRREQRSPRGPRRRETATQTQETLEACHASYLNARAALVERLAEHPAREQETPQERADALDALNDHIGSERVAPRTLFSRVLTALLP